LFHIFSSPVSSSILLPNSTCVAASPDIETLQEVLLLVADIPKVFQLTEVKSENKEPVIALPTCRRTLWPYVLASRRDMYDSIAKAPQLDNNFPTNGEPFEESLHSSSLYSLDCPSAGIQALFFISLNLPIT
jgi:hypothetical protein